MLFNQIMCIPWKTMSSKFCLSGKMLDGSFIILNEVITDYLVKLISKNSPNLKLNKTKVKILITKPYQISTVGGV